MMTIKPYSIEVVGCVMKPLNQGGESRGVFLFEILLSETKGIKCKRVENGMFESRAGTVWMGFAKGKLENPVKILCGQIRSIIEESAGHRGERATGGKAPMGVVDPWAYATGSTLTPSDDY